MSLIGSCLVDVVGRLGFQLANFLLDLGFHAEPVLPRELTQRSRIEEQLL